jgi:hypothetical protein
MLEFEDEESFWVPIKGEDSESKEMKVQGHIRISISILPQLE